MGVIASQITSLTIVYPIFYWDADQRKHQSSASLAFVRVNSPHKWPVTRKMFPFDDVIMQLTTPGASALPDMHGTDLDCLCIRGGWRRSENGTSSGITNPKNIHIWYKIISRNKLSCSIVSFYQQREITSDGQLKHTNNNPVRRVFLFDILHFNRGNNNTI